MPYTVTATRPMLRHREPGTVGVPNAFYPTVVSRRAVATLEEARRAARRVLEPILPGGILPDDLGRLVNAAWSLPESGGTVGPLPDGTVIEVERVEWGELWPDERLPDSNTTDAEMIDAYNARQPSAAR